MRQRSNSFKIINIGHCQAHADVKLSPSGGWSDKLESEMRMQTHQSTIMDGCRKASDVGWRESGSNFLSTQTVADF